MKQIIKSFFILVLFANFGCKTETPQYTAITVLIDVSDEKFRDENFKNENLPKFLSLMDLDIEKGGFSGGEVKLSLINEVSDSKSKTIKIPCGEPGMMGENPLNRLDAVKQFHEKLGGGISDILEKADWGTDASKIYQKVTRECLKMDRISADRKLLIIYSDMLENSKQFSFYGNNWKAQIENMLLDPEATIGKLAKNGPALPDLSEFEIYIISARTSGNDEKINLSEQLWTGIFEYQGAVVSFNSSLDI